MTIEPSQAHTVYRPAVLPPKPAPVTLKPKLIHEADAALIRARTHKAWGFWSAIGSGYASNVTRSAELADRVAALLAGGTAMTVTDLHRHFGVSDNYMQDVLREMRAAGRVATTKGARGVNLWGLV